MTTNQASDHTRHADGVSTERENSARRLRAEWTGQAPGPSVSKRKEIREQIDGMDSADLLSRVWEAAPPPVNPHTYVQLVVSCIGHGTRRTNVDEVESYVPDAALSQLPSTTNIPSVPPVLSIEQHAKLIDPEENSWTSGGTEVVLGPVAEQLRSFGADELDPRRVADAARHLVETGDVSEIGSLFFDTEPSSRRTRQNPGPTPQEKRRTGDPQEEGRTEDPEATAIDTPKDLADADLSEAVEEALFVAERRYNGVGPAIGGWTSDLRRAKGDLKRAKGHPLSAAVKQRVDLLPEVVIEELLGRSPLGSYPRNDLPTELYESIVEWRPIIADSEPLAAVLQMNLTAHQRDDEWEKEGNCTGIVFDHKKIFAAFGMMPKTGYNRGINSGMLKEIYRRKVDQEFRLTDWNGDEGKARVIESHGIPREIVQKAKQVMLGPDDYDDWTYLISGKTASNPNWTRELRKQRRDLIAENEPVIEPPECARRIQEYLNTLGQQYFGHGAHGNLRPEKLDEAIWAVADTVGEEQRRDQELRKLYWVRKFPQPLYLPCDRFPRLKADYANQAMNLPSTVLRSIYTERDYELDLSKAHLASYVPVAKREGLEVPTLEKCLQANLRGDEELLEGGDLWTDLASSVNTDVFDDPKALRSAVKRSYSAVYGSGRQNVLYRIYEKYGKLTGDYPGEGLEPLRPLLSHPLMEELLETRDKLELLINERGGLEDANGRFIPVSAWDQTKRKENRWRGVMAYVNASYEQELMLPIFEEAWDERERDGQTRFKVWLYQADGVTVRIDRRYSHANQIERLQSAVAEEAAELGVPTELEVDYTG